MQNLNLDYLIELYLGETPYEGMAPVKVKEMALQEINRRTTDYRISNKIEHLVNHLNALTWTVEMPKSDSLVIFIDNAYHDEVSLLAIQFEVFSSLLYHPGLSEHWQNINSLTKKLDELWALDPEHLRHSSKFADRRSLSVSQEYYQIPSSGNFIYGKSKTWRYQVSASLGYDYMNGIVQHCLKSEFAVLPLFFIKWKYNRSVVLSFLAHLHALKSSSTFLWVLFITTKPPGNEINDIVRDMRLFVRKLPGISSAKSDYLQYSIVEQDENEKFNFSQFLLELEDFTKRPLF